MQTVQYQSNGITIVANLYIPASKPDSSAERRPAIALAPPFGGIKEQVSGKYAKLLADRGYVTLAYDSAYRGDSFGEPRYLEDPKQAMEDVKSAVTYLAERPEVDVERIGAIGFGAGGGWVINAAAVDERIRILATVSLVDLCALFRCGLGGFVVRSDLDARVAEAVEMRWREEQGAEPTLEHIFPNTLSEVPPNSPGVYREATEYYRTPRAMHPNATNLYMTRSIELLAEELPAIQSLRKVEQRTLVLCGQHADTKYFTDYAFKYSVGPKTISVLPDMYHFDLYDNFDKTMPTIEEHFSRL